ncbi:MAG TPA: helix-turn-helix domain-containing protein [Dehalococcoidia bacterium]|nr:helix-turn-helix domain-containing protein [Dehalococcoidia bacterium]
MLRLSLTEDERDALQRLRRDATLTPLERDHVEILLLAAAGWSAPRIANHVGRCAAMVRTRLKAFAETGVPSVRCQRPGPPPHTARREQVAAAIDRLLGEERTWTAAQVAMALAEDGITLSPRQTRKYLQRNATWRRTVRTLRHKQDPARVARAEQQLAVLQKKGRPGG